MKLVLKQGVHTTGIELIVAEADIGALSRDQVPNVLLKIGETLLLLLKIFYEGLWLERFCFASSENLGAIHAWRMRKVIDCRDHVYADEIDAEK